MKNIHFFSNNKNNIAVNAYNYKMFQFPEGVSRNDIIRILEVNESKESAEPSIYQAHKWSQLYLILTGECNLRCKYCAQHRGTEKAMSEEIMTNAVSDFLKNSNNDSGVVFYGGEPMLNEPVLTKAVQLVRSTSNTIEITLFTNGNLISKEYAQWLADNNVGVIVSIDGDEISHNKMRISDVKEGLNHADTVKGFINCRDAGCTVGISCVLGPHNIPRIEEVTKYLCLLKPANLGMNILHSPGRTGFAHSIEDAADASIKAAVTASKHDLEIEQVARILRSIIFEEPRRAECPACGGRLVVTPSGLFGPCEGAYPFCKSWFFNDKSEAYDHSIQLKNWAEQKRNSCSDCISLGMCGAGCALNAYLDYDSYTGYDNRTCALARSVANTAMDLLLSDLKSVEAIREITIDDKILILGNLIRNNSRPLRSHSNYGVCKK